MLKSLSQYKDIGLLILRVGLGIMFIIHGQGKMFGGPEVWAGVGAKGMGALGINFAPAFWGFMAAFAEFGGGILLIIGLATRPAAILLAFTMFVAMMVHLVGGDPFVPKVSYPLELMIVFVAMIFLGPGKYSLDKG